MTAVTITSNKIVSDEVKDNQALLEPSYRKKNKLTFLANPVLFCEIWRHQQHTSIYRQENVTQGQGASHAPHHFQVLSILEALVGSAPGMDLMVAVEAAAAAAAAVGSAQLPLSSCTDTSKEKRVCGTQKCWVMANEWRAFTSMRHNWVLLRGDAGLVLCRTEYSSAPFESLPLKSARYP